VEVNILNPDVAKPPIIWAGQNRYQPRTIQFSIGNEEPDLSNIRQYTWNFGDGTTGVSEGGAIGHDYTDALDRDQCCPKQDRVKLKAAESKGAWVQRGGGLRVTWVACRRGYPTTPSNHDR